MKRKINIILILTTFLGILIISKYNNQKTQQKLVPNNYISSYTSPEVCSFWTCFEYREYRYEKNIFELNHPYIVVDNTNIALLHEAIQQFKEEGRIEKINFDYKTQLKNEDYFFAVYKRNKSSQRKELNYFLITYFDTENNTLYYFNYDNIYNK